VSDMRDTEIALYQRLQEQVLVAHGQRDAALAELAAAKVEIKRLREILEFLPDDDAALDVNIGETK